VGYHRFVRFAKWTIYGEPNFRSARGNFNQLKQGLITLPPMPCFQKEKVRARAITLERKIFLRDSPTGIEHVEYDGLVCRLRAWSPNALGSIVCWTGRL
jgi:hypothetical protein